MVKDPFYSDWCSAKTKFDREAIKGCKAVSFYKWKEIKLLYLFAIPSWKEKYWGYLVSSLSGKKSKLDFIALQAMFILAKKKERFVAKTARDKNMTQKKYTTPTKDRKKDDKMRESVSQKKTGWVLPGFTWNRASWPREYKNCLISNSQPFL